MQQTLIRSFISLLVIVLASATPVHADVQMLQSDNCDDYPNWEWAQWEYDWYADIREGLDPDGNEIACDHLPRGGIGPAWWTDEIPDDVDEAMLYSVVDGDTIKVIIDGKEETIRFYRADTPEMEACGGVEATDFLRDVLSLNDEGLTLWLESDETPRDRYDRRLAYIWFTIDGQPYMLNEVLIRSGWARDVDYGDRLYHTHLQMAAGFAERYKIGQYDLCGGFMAEDLSNTPLDEIGQEGPGAGTCDPAYPDKDVCIPPIEVTGDLDCGQIEYRRFTVLPPDPHNFDGDGNGIGCEG